MIKSIVSFIWKFVKWPLIMVSIFFITAILSGIIFDLRTPEQIVKDNAQIEQKKIQIAEKELQKIEEEKQKKKDEENAIAEKAKKDEEERIEKEKQDKIDEKEIAKIKKKYEAIMKDSYIHEIKQELARRRFTLTSSDFEKSPDGSNQVAEYFM
jgi:uncharacterized protein YpuA (DUF1002 family)